MPSPKRSARLVVILGALVMLPHPTLAEHRARSVEVGATYTFLRFDSQSGLANRFAPSLIVNYNFNIRHGAELEYTSTTATADAGPGLGADVDMVRLGYTFTAKRRPKLSPFLRAGIGFWSVDPEMTTGPPGPFEEPEDNFMIYGGGGVRLFLNDRLALRFAATVDLIERGNGLLNGDVQASGDFGLIFYIGGSGDSASAPEPIDASEE